LRRASERLSGADKLRASLDPNRPLGLGFARVHRADGRLVRLGAELHPGELVALHFADTAVGARIEGEAPPPVVTPKPVRRAASTPVDQGSLF